MGAHNGSKMWLPFRSPRLFPQNQFYRPVHPRHPHLWMDLFEVGLSMEGHFQTSGTSVIIADGCQALSAELCKQCRRMTWDLRGTRLAPGGATRNQNVSLLGTGYLAIIAPYTISPYHSPRTTTQRVTFTSNLRQNISWSATLAVVNPWEWSQLPPSLNVQRLRMRLVLPKITAKTMFQVL